MIIPSGGEGIQIVHIFGVLMFAMIFIAICSYPSKLPKKPCHITKNIKIYLLMGAMFAMTLLLWFFENSQLIRGI